MFKVVCSLSLNLEVVATQCVVGTYVMTLSHQVHVDHAFHNQRANPQERRLYYNLKNQAYKHRHLKIGQDLLQLVLVNNIEFCNKNVKFRLTFMQDNRIRQGRFNINGRRITWFSM